MHISILLGGSARGEILNPHLTFLGCLLARSLGNLTHKLFSLFCWLEKEEKGNTTGISSQNQNQN
jgi:hypothetical protein